MATCRRDCFNCPFPDCINDRLVSEDFKEANARDRDIRRERQPPEVRRRRENERRKRREKRRRLRGDDTPARELKARAKNNAEYSPEKRHEMYMRDREAVLAAQKAYREENREAILKYKREYRMKHPDYLQNYHNENEKRLRKKQIQIKLFRKSLLLSQRQFAKKVGVSPHTIHNWETGRTPANWAKIKAAFPDFERRKL